MSGIHKYQELLKQRFGFDTFRAGQEAVIQRLLEGQSALAIFPTGSGKSLCFQLPALCLEGVTVVVSPLIALMKDQIDNLTRIGVSAARYDSTLTQDEAARVKDELQRGKLKILYIAPERLADERFRVLLSRVKIALLAIDEAHCISEWGHNFRPDYMRLAQFAKDAGIKVILALTATATPLVARQIATALKIEPVNIIRTTFHRSNLQINVSLADSQRRYAQLFETIKARDVGSTIIYATTQKGAEKLAEHLQSRGLPALVYHAGLKSEERASIQEAFMQGSGIVVATIAFGMGIDKADIRYVYHFNMPKSLEGYAQEIGRAGRDGKPAICELFADINDLTILENFVYGDTPTKAQITELLEQLLRVQSLSHISIWELSTLINLKTIVIETLLAYLELDGLIESQGHFYTEYQLDLKQPIEQICANFDDRRQEFLLRFFQSAKPGKRYLNLNRRETATLLAIEPELVGKTIDYLETHGFLTAKPSGVRRRFRLLKNVEHLEFLAENLFKRFQEHEERQINRLKEVVSFVETQECRSRLLAQYFGEDLDRPCEHCDLCITRTPIRINKRESLKLSEAQLALISAEIQSDVWSTPRSLALFLAGLTPALGKNRSIKERPNFSKLCDAPFASVLTAVETFWKYSTT